MFTHARNDTCTHRVVKQALRASGANETDAFEGGLYVCFVSSWSSKNKIDKTYSVPPKSRAHTIRDSAKDIENIRLNLTTKEVTTENSTRTSPSVADPSDIGWAKLNNTKWLLDLLLWGPTEDDFEAEGHSELDLDFDYEIFNNS